MCKTNLLERLCGRETERLPFWFMRQAGRYLPEYRELKKKCPSFLDLCLTPRFAAEATLQPVRRFDPDGAILFSDILLVPHAMGQKLRFDEEKGPVLSRISNERDVLALIRNDAFLSPVYEAIERVKEQLPKKTALIGFCGGPWTVACYMIEGKGKSAFHRAQKAAENDAPFLSFLMDDLEKASLSHLLEQIRAGVQVLQIFESHAGVLEKPEFERLVVEPTRRLVEGVRKKEPHIPIVGYVRGLGPDELLLYARKTGVNALSFDQGVSRKELLTRMPEGLVLQGNLDPALLLHGGADMEKETKTIKTDWGKKHVFNLGGGILPTTPPENVARLVDVLKE